MKKLVMSFLFLSFSLSSFAEPRMERTSKEVGKGKFVMGEDGRTYCTHSRTDLAFTMPLKILGLEVLNKNSKNSAIYYYTGQHQTGGLKLNLYKKVQGDSEFTKYIGMNTNTYFMDDLNRLDEATVDVGFRFMNMADAKRGVTTLLCSK